MPHLWINKNDEVGWQTLTLGLGSTALDPATLGLRLPGIPPTVPLLQRIVRRDHPEQWALFAPPDRIRINGRLELLGLRLLHDRDRLEVRGLPPFYFSTESLAAVEKFPGSEKTVFCPRCRDAIHAGADAVRCPGCGMWHHQMAGRNCFTYAETCALCSQRSALDGRYRWTPEEVE